MTMNEEQARQITYGMNRSATRIEPQVSLNADSLPQQSENRIKPVENSTIASMHSRSCHLVPHSHQFLLRTIPFDERLKVFISSDMIELYDVREFVAQDLIERGIDAWIHETHAGARPESVVETSLRATEAADIYVGVFWRKYGQVTIQEYRYARTLNRPCFIYIRDKHCRRDTELEEFLSAEVYDPQCGVNYAYFDSAVVLGKRVASDIMAWLVRRHREMEVELQQVQTAQTELVRLRDELDRLRSNADDGRA